MWHVWCWAGASRLRRTRAEAAKTREALLSAARTTFHAQGLAGTTLQAVAARAGVTRGAIQWHFGTKSDLLAALAREHAEAPVGAAGPADGEPDSPLRRLRHLLVGWAAEAARRPGDRALAEMAALAAGPGAAAGRAVLLREAEVLQEQCEVLLRKAIGALEVRGDVDVEATARAAVGLAHGLVDLRLLAAAGPEAGEAVAAGVDLLLGSIATA